MLGTKSKVMIEANMREKKESTLKLGYRREIAKVFVDSFSNEEIDKTLIAQEIENFLDLAESSYNLAALKSQMESVVRKLSQHGGDFLPS